MIETPRAALTADQIAEYAGFISFGTNDLTQMTYGLSRDDAEKAFLVAYLEQGILDRNPFATLDADGVGQLMEIAIQKGRGARPGLETGVCGEHGGDPESIELCRTLGLDYVSCSPPRVPVARLAAAIGDLIRRARSRHDIMGCDEGRQMTSEATPPAESVPIESRNWAVGAHLSAFVMFVGIPSPLGPLAV